MNVESVHSDEGTEIKMTVSKRSDSGKDFLTIKTINRSTATKRQLQREYQGAGISQLAGWKVGMRELEVYMQLTSGRIVHFGLCPFQDDVFVVFVEFPVGLSGKIPGRGEVKRRDESVPMIELKPLTRPLSIYLNDSNHLRRFQRLAQRAHFRRSCRIHRANPANGRSPFVRNLRLKHGRDQRVRRLGPASSPVPPKTVN